MMVRRAELSLAKMGGTFTKGPLMVLIKPCAIVLENDTKNMNEIVYREHVSI